MSKSRRGTEIWMSSNRVLTGGSPKTRPASLSSRKTHPHRNPNFETTETMLLINLWGDPKVQKALITNHRKHPVISKIAEQMQQRGYFRTPEEINTRIKNLKCFYNRIKKELDAGLIPYPTWRHYPAMDKIMTTPVFSARPEEMPKPSVRTGMEPDSTASDSKSDEWSEDESFPADLLTTELTYDDDVQLENWNYGRDSTENDLDIDVEEVIIPKEEPIEVEDDDEQIPEDTIGYTEQNKRLHKTSMGPKRRGDFWTSHNRVLNGGSKKFNGRNPNFDTEETRLLITLWGDPKIQKTLITTHKKHPVIARLAEQLREYGYNRTTEEINTRIKNLKCFYNRIKKDIEVGIITEPTWKHYRAMERIMTRPIFSVRPNEVPKPSPRFKMEGLNENNENQQLKEHRQRMQDIYMERSETENYYDDDDELFTQEMFEAEMDCEIAEFTSNGDDDAHDVGKAMEKSRQSPTITDKVEIKTEKDSDEEKIEPESELIVPKEEPIDVDADEVEEVNKRVHDENGDAEEANEIFPKLSAYLQLASNNQSTATPAHQPNNKIITTIANNATPSSTEKSAAGSNAVKIAKPMLLAPHSQQHQPGKISLVPTNVLLKPPQQQIQLRPQAQHILYNPGLVSNSAIGTSGTPAQMPNGMKVLLVNTLPQNGVVSANGPSDSQQKIITTNAMKANCITSTVPNIGEARNKSAEARNHKMSMGNSAGFRTIMTQLLSIQTQNLEVSRQRLDLERQRLDFEKSVAERILAALPQFFMPPPPMQPAPQSISQPAMSEERSTPPMPLLTPKIEKED